MLLHYTSQAPNPDRVRYFLQEKGRWDDVPKVEVSIMNGEHRAEAYRRVSPLAQVPALELDGGGALTESRAICTYFEGVFPEPNLMGTTPEERGTIEMWDRRVELTYLMPIAQWFRHSHPAMAALETPQLPDWADVNTGRAKKMIAFLDKRLQVSEFLAGDRFTIADITLYVALGFGRLVRFKPWEDHAALGAWRQRMSDRPGMV